MFFLPSQQYMHRDIHPSFVLPACVTARDPRLSHTLPGPCASHAPSLRLSRAPYASLHTHPRCSHREVLVGRESSESVTGGNYMSHRYSDLWNTIVFHCIPFEAA